MQALFQKKMDFQGWILPSFFIKMKKKKGTPTFYTVCYVFRMFPIKTLAFFVDCVIMSVVNLSGGALWLTKFLMIALCAVLARTSAPFLQFPRAIASM